MSANLVNIYLICTLWKYFKRFYWSKDHEGYLRISTKLATKHHWLSEILKGACISSRVDSVVFCFVVFFNCYTIYLSEVNIGSPRQSNDWPSFAVWVHVYLVLSSSFLCLCSWYLYKTATSNAELNLSIFNYCSLMIFYLFHVINYIFILLEYIFRRKLHFSRRIHLPQKITFSHLPQKMTFSRRIHLLQGPLDTSCLYYHFYGLYGL